MTDEFERLDDWPIPAIDEIEKRDEAGWVQRKLAEADWPRCKICNSELQDQVFLIFHAQETPNGMVCVLCETRAQLAAAHAELREISLALNDPADNLISTTARCVARLRERLEEKG
jgi:hypothetical protein